jgi:hypothetical protein
MKCAAVSARITADLMGFARPPKIEGHPEPHFGRKALVGQYVRTYTRAWHVPPGRVSKGARARYERDHGTEGRLDCAAVINARRHIGHK